MENKNQILKFLFWLFLGFIIMFIGITRPKAWTTMNVCSDSALSSCGKYRALDGNGTLSTKTIGTNYSGTIIGFDFFLSLNTQINKNYKIRINFYGDDLKSIVNANMVSVAYYNGSSWSDSTLVGIQKQNPSGYSTWIDIYFTMPQASSKLWITIDDSENGNDITGTSYYGINSVQFDVVDQNTDIMNNANQNANNIINNNNNNTQNIIDNSNSNTQAIIDSNKVCTTYNKDEIEIDGKYLGSNGNTYTSTNYGITDYISTNGEITVITKLTFDPGIYVCYYTGNKGLISCQNEYNLTELTIPSNADYFRFSINKNSDMPIFKVCENGNEAINKTNKGILGKLKELIQGLFDTSGPDTNGLNGIAGYLPPGPVDSILNLPLTFFNQLNSTLGGSCTPIVVTLPFVNSTLTLPCWSDYMSQYLTSFGTLWSFIGAVASVIILYRYLLALYVWVDDVLMLRYNMHEDFGGNSTNFGGV